MLDQDRLKIKANYQRQRERERERIFMDLWICERERDQKEDMKELVEEGEASK